MIVGCYYLTLYCDSIEGGNESPHNEDYMRHMFPDQYGPVSDGGARQAHDIDATGNNKTEAMRKAKDRGWLVKGDKAYCPGCVELGRHK